MVLFNDHFEEFSRHENCININNQSKMKCSCLKVLEDKKIRLAVSDYALSFGKKAKRTKEQMVIDWYRYAKPSTRNNICWHIPFSANTEHATDVQEGR